MRDNHSGSPFDDAFHVLLDNSFRLRIECTRRRLVEDQDLRVVDERSGDGDALALAAGGGTALSTMVS